MKATIYNAGTEMDVEYPSELGDMMVGCYEAISAGGDAEIVAPQELNPLFDDLEKALGITISRSPTAINLTSAPTDDNKVMIAYSSGMDSTSHALYWRAQGKDVILFHVKSLNHSYPDEARYALAFSKAYNIPIVVIEPKWVKQTAYVDNPVKNQTILAYMVDYGRSIGCIHYGMGNYATDKLMAQIQGYWTTDSIELYKTFNRYICGLLPGYTYHNMPYDKYGAFEFIVKNDPGAWVYVNSCLRPYRFKDYTHEQTVKKYNVPLIPHHCGVCYKCALEYLMLADLGYYPIDVTYARKCINTIREQDGSTFTMGVRKQMSDAEALRKILGRDIVRSRWDPVITKGVRRK